MGGLYLVSTNCGSTFLDALNKITASLQMITLITKT